MEKTSLSVLFILLMSFSLAAQNSRKTLGAVKTEGSLKIDGKLDEAEWIAAPVAKDFVQFQPKNGAKPYLQTEVKVLYSNEAIYFGAFMHDPNPDSILTQLGMRDAGEINADQFKIYINPYDDGLNDFVFMISAAGVQTDQKYYDGGMDITWDAVWDSEVSITDSGWIAEVEIPYSAIRFPEKTEQNWALNFERIIRRIREFSNWNYVDIEQENYADQAGLLTGIRNIEAPLRLAFIPYAGFNVENFPYNIPGRRNTSYSLNGGLDLQYGISESFTLDMTLVPNFSQVQSDHEILNLTPFEVQYEENRPFFKEGTELFNKGGLFYSRRIGSEPVDVFRPYEEAREHEIIVENPLETQLLNAFKISGRTGSNLGIGLFNAVTSKTYARLRDTITNGERQLLTQPFSNYNVLVLDQTLKNNSYLTFTNTNVWRDNAGFTSNVSGGKFRFSDKENNYAVRGGAAISLNDYDNNHQFQPGHHYFLEGGKVSGKFRYLLSRWVESDTYDPNELGYLPRNNYISHSLDVAYNVYEPFWKFLFMYNELSIYRDELYSPNTFTAFGIETSSIFTTRNWFTFNIHTEVVPVEGHDYFEPRVPGRHFDVKPYWGIGGWISSDYRKTFALDGGIDFYRSSFFDHDLWQYRLAPRFRLNDHLSIFPEFNYSNARNDVGYVYDDSTAIVFGKRRVETISNLLNVQYFINNNLSAQLGFRHYWSLATYNKFYELAENGELIEESEYKGDHDVNFNALNVDFRIIYRYAPGSEMSLVWKHEMIRSENVPVEGYFTNFDYILRQPRLNIVSLRVLYYLDYARLRRRR